MIRIENDADRQIESIDLNENIILQIHLLIIIISSGTDCLKSKSCNKYYALSSRKYCCLAKIILPAPDKQS